MKRMFLVAVLFAAVPAYAQGTDAAKPAAPTAPVAGAKFTLDTPLQDIVADAQGKAVIEKHFPGMIAMPEYEMFKAIGLNQLKTLADGKITDAMMTATAADLAAIK